MRDSEARIDKLLVVGHFVGRAVEPPDVLGYRFLLSERGILAQIPRYSAVYRASGYGKNLLEEPLRLCSCS
jgi:hypothetical protein